MKVVQIIIEVYHCQAVYVNYSVEFCIIELDKFVSDHNILNERQIGFRTSYRTTDHIFYIKIYHRQISKIQRTCIYMLAL